MNSILNIFLKLPNSVEITFTLILMVYCFLNKLFIYQNITLKALYSHKQQENKTFLSKNNAFLA